MPIGVPTNYISTGNNGQMKLHLARKKKGDITCCGDIAWSKMQERKDKDGNTKDMFWKGKISLDGSAGGQREHGEYYHFRSSFPASLSVYGSGAW